MKDQVLSIEQVQELTELGFDISKYSSLMWTSCGSCRSCRGQDNDTLHFENKGFCGYKDITPTLTIGDILKILPLTIKDFTPNYTRRIDGNNILYRKNNWECDIILKEFKRYKNLINNLFDCLIWCIKNEEI